MYSFTMEDIFYNVSHPAGFSGIGSLAKASTKKQHEAKEFLEKQPTYRRFRVPRRKIKRAQVEAPGVGVQFQADLFDLSKLSWHNKSNKWVVLVVDAFSRFVACEPAKNKTGPVIAHALDVIFSRLTTQNRIAPHAQLATDLGNEFYNQHATEIYQKYNLAHWPLRSPIKCAFAEISGRYVVARLYKIMDHRKNKTWIGVLQASVEAKNARKNKKTAGLSPNEINFDNQELVHKSLYPNGYIRPQFTLTIGDRVQVVKNRLPFAKSYHGYYSDKVYIVSKLHAYSVPRYSIIDEEDSEPIDGTWYADELFLLR